MEVKDIVIRAKEEFKQTEVGLIPEDWTSVELRQNIKLISGQHILAQNYNYNEQGIPYLTGPADFGVIYPVITKWTDRPKSTASKNDILITVKGDGVGKINLQILSIVAISRQLMAINTLKIDHLFLYYCLSSRFQLLQDLSSGSTVPGLSRENIQQIKIPLPPTKAEQTAIATVLSDTDALIGRLETLIEKKRAIKQGAMQQLLKPKEGWAVKKLGEIADTRSGKRLPLGKSLCEEETPYPYIRIVDMTEAGISLDEIRYVPEEVFPTIKNYRIFKEDIYISVAGTLGLVGRIPAELNGANLTENANKLTNITCDVNYLLFVLKSDLIQGKINSERTLGAQPKLALVRIRNFEIPLPSKEEQTRIAQILSDMDAEIAGLEQKLAKYKLVKQGMMQELLTGKTRLV